MKWRVVWALAVLVAGAIGAAMLARVEKPEPERYAAWPRLPELEALAAEMGGKGVRVHLDRHNPQLRAYSSGRDIVITTSENGPLWVNGERNWRLVGVIAHETGHLLHGHESHNGETAEGDQREADEFAGFAMAKLGATLDQAMSFYPSGIDKAMKEAIEKGWRRGIEGR